MTTAQGKVTLDATAKAAADKAAAAALASFNKLVSNASDYTTDSWTAAQNAATQLTNDQTAGVTPSALTTDANALLGFIGALKTVGVTNTTALTQTLQDLASFSPVVSSTVTQAQVDAYTKALGVVKADLNNTTTGLASQICY